MSGAVETSVTDTRSGGCLCGAVRFSARLYRSTYGACHCEMCRRWSGSALLAISVPTGNITWEGEDNIATLQSSDWAKRAWCARCGSGLYYAVTLEGPHFGTTEIPIGLFDDASGLTLDHEIFFDQKPDSFAYAGETKKLSRAETLAMFGDDASPEE
ncbi:MAG: GFA family protein [Pseudorhodobacter sp.]|nr:GFA family protein [Pseudorhodobacter sp.]